MGHKNVNITDGVIDLDPGHHGHSHLHPNPCIFYGSVAIFPRHNIYSAVTTPGNLFSFNCHPMPEHVNSASFYGVPPPPYIVVQPHHPAANFDLAVASWSRQYNPYMAPQSDGLFRNMHYMDDTQSIKGKSSDNAPLNHQLQNTSAGPSSSVGPDQLRGNPLFGTLGYPAPDISRNNVGFLHTHISHPFHPTSRCPIESTQGLRGYHINSPSRVAISSHRIAQRNSSNAGISSFQDAVGARPTLMAPIPATNICSYWPHPRETSLGHNARHPNSPHLRILPEDEVAILEIPRDHEGGSIDRHRDMRLDIDHMSYEELLTLGEHIGSVTTGLTENFIRKNLKTRTLTTSPTGVNHNQASCPDQPKIDFCVICQDDYDFEETIGKLDCGHEYHGACLKKWLLIKNTCPVCKSTALSSRTDL